MQGLSEQGAEIIYIAELGMHLTHSQLYISSFSSLHECLQPTWWVPSFCPALVLNQTKTCSNPNNLHSKNEGVPKAIFWKWSLKPFLSQAAAFWADISNQHLPTHAEELPFPPLHAPISSYLCAQTGTKLEDKKGLAGILPALVIQQLCEPTRALFAKQ